MIENPEISVVMPVYNTKEEYLREAVESILNQTFRNFEFIILNDGSVNNAEEVILSYADERIKYYKNECNEGIAKSRNKLLNEANGKYVAFCDSDDIYCPYRLEEQIKFLDTHPEYGAVSSNMVVFGKINTLLNNPETVSFFDLLRACCFPMPCAMLRKSYFQKYDLKFNEDFSTAEDYELWSRAVRYMKFYNIQDNLCLYRWHDTNISVTSQDNMLQNAQRVQKSMLDFLESDTSKQHSLLQFLHSNTIRSNAKLKYSFTEKIFSIKNFYNFNEKYKVIKILGITLKFGTK